MVDEGDLVSKLTKVGRILVKSGWYRKQYLRGTRIRENTKLVEDFLVLARQDLEAAKTLLERRLNNLAVYHVQQSVEKVAKAYALDSFLISKDEAVEDRHLSPMAFLRILYKKIGREYLDLVQDTLPKVSVDVRREKVLISVKQDEIVRLSAEEIRKYLASSKQMEESYRGVLKMAFHDPIADAFESDLRDNLRKLGERTLNARIGALASFAPLFTLSILTFPHESYTRYPESKFKPSEYNNDIGIVQCVGEILQLIEDVIEEFSKSLSEPQNGLERD
jgi:HEPN domain-containing protein